MKRSLALLLTLLLTSTSVGDTKTGSITLKEGHTKAVKIAVGDELKGQCEWYINPDFFKKRVISVQCKIQNPTKQPLYYGYFVAFFDSNDKLVATSSMTSMNDPIAPGKDTYVGNVVNLPNELIPKITKYQVTLISSGKPFGQ